MNDTRTRTVRTAVGLLLLVTTSFCVLLVSLIWFGHASGEAGAAPRGLVAPELTPIIIPTPYPVFTATVDVLPSASLVGIGEAITVEIQIRTSEGCHYALYESALFQDDNELFTYVDPPTHTVGPPGAYRYRLSAVAPGEVVFRAVLYGERYCGDYWNWRYLNSISGPVTVVSRENLTKGLYFPIIYQAP